MAGNWIAGAVQHPGALHRQMGVPQGQPIPAQKLEHAAQAGGLLGERARLAETLKGLPHHAWGGPVQPGQPSVVGERGPEVFTPRVGGMIHPNPAVGLRPPVARPMQPQQTNPLAMRMAILRHLGGVK